MQIVLLLVNQLSFLVDSECFCYDKRVSNILLFNSHQATAVLC